jgi:hypothetical protein
MKKFMLKTVVAIFLFTVSTVSLCIAGDVDGFRGKKWGAPISEFYKTHQLELRQNDGMNKYVFYSIVGDTMKVRGVNVESIRYFFWKDKFAGVSIFANGETTFNSFKAMIDDRFGLGKSGIGQSSERVMTWDSETTQANLSYQSSTGKVHLVLISKMLDALKEEMNVDRSKPVNENDF